MGFVDINHPIDPGHAALEVGLVRRDNGFVMILALLIGASFSVPPEAAIAEGVADEAARVQLVASVEEALLADKELAFHHSGYLSYWFGRPDWEEAEAGYTAMARSSRLYPLLVAFDEALLGSMRADEAYRSFQMIQVERPELRDGVEALEDTGLHWTMDRLNRVIGSTQTADLDPVTRLQELLGPESELAIRNLGTDPSARRRLEPWWRFQYDAGDRGAGRAYTELVAALRETPGGLTAWRKREALLAGDPDGADWVRYWHRRVRREKDLGARYYDYLSAIQERPDLQDERQQDFRKIAGARSWPPVGNPPRLSEIEGANVPRPRGDLDRRRTPSVDRPTSPSGIQRPVRPTRPAKSGTTRNKSDDRRPTKPARPQRPDSGDAGAVSPR